MKSLVQSKIIRRTDVKIKRLISPGRPGWQQGIPDKHHLAAKTQLVLQGRGGLRPMRAKMGLVNGGGSSGLPIRENDLISMVITTAPTVEFPYNIALLKYHLTNEITIWHLDLRQNYHKHKDDQQPTLLPYNFL